MNNTTIDLTLPNAAPLPSYSTGDGPICPHCGQIIDATGPDYMDGQDIDCPQCGSAISIQAHITVAWTTHAV